MPHQCYPASRFLPALSAVRVAAIIILAIALATPLTLWAEESASVASAKTPNKSYSLLRWLNAQTIKEAKRGRTRIPPYDRRLHFGGWINEDAPSDCYDTRTETLLRDASPDVRVVFRRDNACKIRSGAWYDPYTNRVFKTSQSLQVDHVVPLKNAYMTGAWQWSRAARCHYANFMGNDYHLLAVHGRENMSKNSHDPSRYLPPNRAFLCDYARIWMKIKVIWDLQATDEEVAGIRRALQLGKCDLNQQTISEQELREQRAKAANISEACLRPRDSRPVSTDQHDEFADFMDLDDPELRAYYLRRR